MAKSKLQSLTEEQSIAQLNQRYESLRERKIKLQTQRDHALEQLAKLKADAKSQFGTDVLTELQALLERTKSENEKKRAEYQRSLDQIEQKLEEIDEQFAATQSDPQQDAQRG